MAVICHVLKFAQTLFHYLTAFEIICLFLLTWNHIVQGKVVSVVAISNSTFQVGKGNAV